MTAGPDPLIGQTVDRFQIDGMIGKGSMGTVYRGRETASGTPVAVKTMAPEHAEDDELLQRFQREARVGGQIRHPNVARVYTVGSFGDMPYLVMEYIDGPSLQDFVKQRGVPDPKLACNIVRQSALGLKAANSNGSLHRDIKPANIMLTSKGEAKIVDFGIARDHGGDQLRTAVGVVLGSPYYMSPEQSAAQPLDHRSDIYGLGATFYFLLTGRPPFEGKNLVEIIQKRARNELIPIQQINPNVPRRISDIVQKMMQPDPYDRFQNYDDLIQAIDDALSGRAEAAAAAPRPQAAAPAPPPRPRPAPPPPSRPIELPTAWYETTAARIGMVAVGLALLGAAVFLVLK